MNPIVITGGNNGYTMISNRFIDQYMIPAGSSHLKTYLLLMRLLSDPTEEISVSRMADILDCSESDILRSLNYWEKKGLMKLSMEGNGKQKRLCGIAMLPFPEPEAERAQISENLPVKTAKEPEKVPAVFSKEEEMLPPREVSMEELVSDDAFVQFVYIVEQYIGTTLNAMEAETLGWLYKKLGMDISLLEYVVEYCVTNGHKKIRYMETVAIDWHKKNIKTVQQAREEMPLYNKKLYAVMKALGLSNRKAAPVEQQAIEKLFQEFNFSQDMYVEACNRTMMNIHEPNLNYVRSILEGWKNAGAETLEQVKVLDQKKKETDREAKNEKQKSKTVQAKKPGAQFHDFDQRSYDYDELLRQLSGES